ncbi:MAG: 1,4-alpha-glucan-branching enzyme [Desulfobacterales bacterium CG07_land_8_20_14_0_80_52_14]|nr:MAG: 1,4-alpha-glucan-branching enzyme [Desulfobacterales bacterium CG23_combo_of_CG06-09_8_20_14_all_52_9]PIU48940.1 MAG: 1,4-alpha-glucan-branching enzyme [Desulfobacterales bacterium CG07_land_8_20_14_0_80_52_14]
MKEPQSALLKKDPYLKPFEEHLRKRSAAVLQKEIELTQKKSLLIDFASGHEYFGLHFRKGEWIFREWAPHAEAVYLIGDLTGWSENLEFALKRIHPDGHWEIRMPADLLNHGSLYRLRMHWPGGSGDRIPAYVRRVIQDPVTLIFNAQVWRPDSPYSWRHPDFSAPSEPFLIYEAHVGMAQEEERIGTYVEFTEKVIPRIVRAGYNAIQLMAIPEHPYYASFGYQVSSFFAPSSRFGTPEDLKHLIDMAHGQGLTVLMDLVHSHAASNEVEGLSCFDGTEYQYFHQGPHGVHPAWGSRCFDYGKPQVLHFLLSNCRYWLDEFRVDGFRFDGVTSMLYLHHGMAKDFTSYADYFDDSVDEDALTYLTLANKVIHEVRPQAITIAEDVSGMPGLAAPIEEGGYGFDFRFAMGVPDLWIRLTKDLPDEAWPMGRLWYELNNRRPEEKTISYAESHDQALVGDQTLLFRLIGSAIYEHMRVDDNHLSVDRGVALHKMIRLITLATAGDGYLNFMGNEFGHPEWIDFPREGNVWSFRFARRQWRLADDPGLKYHQLGKFDRDMVQLAKRMRFFGSQSIRLLKEHDHEKILIFMRKNLLFCFNFNYLNSYYNYRFYAPIGKYKMILDSDAACFGGHGRLTPDQIHVTTESRTGGVLSLYLPSRTAIVLQKEA